MLRLRMRFFTQHLSFPSIGIQKKYVRVKSTYPLDVHLFLWVESFRFACATSVLEELTPGSSSAFLSHAGQKDNNLGEI